MLFSKPKKAIGLDIGTHSVKAVQMSRSGGRLCVDEVGFAHVDRAMLTNEPVDAHAIAIREALQGLSFGGSLIVGALPGQTVVIRYPRIPDTPQHQMAAAIEREAAQNIPYDLSEVFLDWDVLDELMEGDKKQTKILLVAVKHEVIESRMELAQAAEISYGILGVDSLALADAAEVCEMLRPDETVALVNIGLSSSSIHFVKDGKSNFIRDVNWGGRELANAIMKERRCDAREAERLLENLNTELAAHEAPAPEPSRPAAPVDNASLLDPLDEELGGLGGDPFGEPEPESAPMLMDGGERSLREVLSGALSRVVAEIRRSFDYYEHQLYERPVDRLILSGGAAHISLLGETLMDELGVEKIDLANPAESSLLLGNNAAVGPLLERPAQFMVAVGLAARGMADL